MSQPMNVRLVLALALSVTLGSCSSGATPEPEVASAPDVSAPDASVIGEVNGQTITASELDEWIRDDLFRQQSDSAKKLYELRARAIEKMIDEKIIDVAAAKAGLDADAWIEAEVAALGPVTDEQIAEFYAENEARIGRRGDLETLRPQIREFLESEQPNEVVTRLRAEAQIRVDLEPPRIHVAAIGPSRGSDDAPITIVAFSDYECPFCSRAEPVLEEVMNRYPGKVRLVYRHLPLSFHKNARPAAVASICAEQQNKFWEYHALLFANQRQLGQENLEKYAVEVGLDLDSWNACLEAEPTAARVDEDLLEARTAGASGTPAFFINGIPLSGALPAEDFAEVIDRELARLAVSESAS